LQQQDLRSRRKRTRREQFLDDMERVVPWIDLRAVIELFYPKPSGAGRRPQQARPQGSTVPSSDAP